MPWVQYTEAQDSGRPRELPDGDERIPERQPELRSMLQAHQTEWQSPCVYVLGEVGLSLAQLQLRTLVPFLPPFPLSGSTRLAAARPVAMVTTAWLLVGGGAQGRFSQSAH